MLGVSVAVVGAVTELIVDEAIVAVASAVEQLPRVSCARYQDICDSPGAAAAASSGTTPSCTLRRVL